MVAGRLGHGGGGTTTLKAYAAWVSEADQRAAKNIGGRMPERPGELDATERAKTEPRSPYERIAAQLRAEILSGARAHGELASPVKELAAEQGVSVGTAYRAIELLEAWGLLTSANRGRRRTVVVPEGPSSHEPSGAGASAPSPPDRRDVSADRTPAARPEEAPDGQTRYWVLTLRGPDGRRYRPRHVREDITDPDSFRAHLVAIARVEAPEETDGGEGWIGDYELEVREPGHEHQEPLLTLRWQGNS